MHAAMKYLSIIIVTVGGLWGEICQGLEGLLQSSDQCGALSWEAPGAGLRVRLGPCKRSHTFQSISHKVQAVLNCSCPILAEGLQVCCYYLLFHFQQSD